MKSFYSGFRIKARGIYEGFMRQTLNVEKILISHTRYTILKNIGGFVFCVQRKAALEKKHWRTGSSS